MHSVSEDSPGAAIRFSLVIGTIVGLYMAAVAAFGALHGFANVLHFGQGTGLLVNACVFPAAVILGVYLIRVVVVRRGGSPFAIIAGDFRRVPKSDAIITATSIFLGCAGTMIAYTPIKRMIDDVRGFPLDHALADLDHHIFSMDAWRITDSIFGSPLLTGMLQLCYLLWFVFVWFSVVLSMLVGRKPLRWQYGIAFFLCWILVGSLAAYFLASAGPCFYEVAFHDGRFSELMDHLRRTDAAMRQISPYLGLGSFDAESMLWDGYVKHKDEFGIGISAMPSLHVTISCLMALAAYRVSRLAGHAMTAFAVIIWIGSIQLGWHYALDGVVGAGMAFGIWQLAGVITTRFILREAGTARFAVPEAEAASLG